ncbi:MAG: hypothetical protein CMN78_01870 [Spirochaetales bacterium]|nr:hypothetical protein [Spirochaetales bacterium]
MEIREVTTQRDLRRFIRFPGGLYAHDPLWIPPIWREESGAYSKKGNPILSNSDFVLTIAMDGDLCVGRNLTYVDNAFNAYNASNTGFFGSFECINNAMAFETLINHSESWLRNRKIDLVRGPINPVAEHWGFLFESNGDPPIFLSPHNPTYYLDLFATRGYIKSKDLLAYDVNRNQEYEIPGRIDRFLDILKKRKPSLSVRRIDRRHIIDDAEIIWKLSNCAYAGNWGYVPVSRDVMLDLVRRLRRIMDPDAIWFVEDGGTPVGYCLGFPDINRIIREIGGRFFPFGFLKFLTLLKHIKHYRLFGLAIHPDYQGMGLDVLLYASLYRSLKPKSIRLEANYILEDNFNIRNALEKLGMNRIRSYRILERNLQ